MPKTAKRNAETAKPPPPYKSLTPAEKYAIRQKMIEEVYRLPERPALYPDSRSGTLHSRVIREGYRLYYYRHFKKAYQTGRVFSWTFFIARHDGEATDDLERLKNCIIHHKQWDQNGIIVQVLGRVSKWIQGNYNSVTENTRMRLSMRTGLGGAKEYFEFVFPPNPDTQNGLLVQTLEYNGERNEDAQ